MEHVVQRKGGVVYESTRGGERGRSFREVVLKGLADDGGLFVPSRPLPRVPSHLLARWRHLSYRELAFEVLSLFIGDADVPSFELRRMIDESYGAFLVEEVLRVRPCAATGGGGQAVNVCELFHGPTFSFKDFALQFLGHLFEYLLRTNARASKDEEPATRHITVLGATSGSVNDPTRALFEAQLN